LSAAAGVGHFHVLISVLTAIRINIHRLDGDVEMLRNDPFQLIQFGEGDGIGFNAAVLDIVVDVHQDIYGALKID
jgi:hypothetical protein